ncbi:hypothetical protein ACWPKS_02690 [Coraliomargarita sp. W4R72]
MGSLKRKGDESLESYYDRLVDHLLSPRFGTFWWVLEKMLIRNLKQEDIPYDYDSDRIGHPHVSILAAGQAYGRGYIPFLLGSHGGYPWKHVSITGLTHSKPEDITYFGSLLHPVRISSQDMLSPNVDADPSILEGTSHQRSNIWPNWDRLEATEEECSRLEKWCERWDLL